MNASGRTLVVLCLLGLPALLGFPAKGQAATPPGPATGLIAAGVHSCAAPGLGPFANITSIWNKVMGFIYNTFRSRERMIQLTLIGVTVGLFIMLRRMPGKV